MQHFEFSSALQSILVKLQNVKANEWIVIELENIGFFFFLFFFIYIKTMKLRYKDENSMVEHLNTSQEFISHAIFLEVPLANEVLALLHIGSLHDSCEINAATHCNLDS